MADMLPDADEQTQVATDSESAATGAPVSESTAATEATAEESVGPDEQQVAESGDDISDLEQFAPPQDAPEEIKALYENLKTFRAKVTQESQVVADEKRQLGELAQLRQYSETDPELAATIAERWAQRIRGGPQPTAETYAPPPTEIRGIPFENMTETEQALAQEVIDLRQTLGGVVQQSASASLQSAMDEITEADPTIDPNEIAAMAVSIRNEILQNPVSPKLLKWAAEIRRATGQITQAQQATLARQTMAQTARRQMAVTSPGAAGVRTEPQPVGKMPLEQIWAIEARKHGVTEPW